MSWRLKLGPEGGEDVSLAQSLWGGAKSWPGGGERGSPAMTNPGAPPSQPASQAVRAKPGLGASHRTYWGGGAKVTFSLFKTASEDGGGVRVEFPGTPPVRPPNLRPTAVKP